MFKQVGIIGLGAMGKPMARRLILGGFQPVVYDVVSAAVEELAAEGAKPAASAAELARSCDCVITILPRDEHIISVYTGPDGVIVNIADGSVCIEMTSALGQTVIDMAAKAEETGKNISFLDAPVSGGVAGAEAGALTIMCGGEKEVYERCAPVLEAMGKKLLYTGGLGSGKSIKMVNQLLNAGNTIVAAEAVYLAKHLGLDMELLCDVVKVSSGSSWVFENNIPKFMLPRKYGEGFRLELLKKDIGLSMDRISQDGLSLPLSTLVYQIYQAMYNQGHGKDNYNVVGEWTEQQNGKGK